MSERVPSVHRDDTLGGLDHECALKWCKFLYERAHWDGDIETYDRYRGLYERLQGSPKGVLYSNDLEARIAQYTKSEAHTGGPQCLKLN